MKFQSITMNNFMRYKGQNVIEFSCDEKRNVTVVLGDNTVGKTTIAQAFRWVLYGAVLTERGKQQEDYQLLNNDILAMMDANSKADVTVELVAVDDEKYVKGFYYDYDSTPSALDFFATNPSEDEVNRFFLNLSNAVEKCHDKKVVATRLKFWKHFI